MGIAVNTSLGRVYVVNSFNNRIQYFDTIGVYAGQAGEYGLDPGKFNFPQGIASTRVQGRSTWPIHPTTECRSWIRTWVRRWRLATYGTAYGQFRRPYDVAADAAGNIYVADTFNQPHPEVRRTATTS